LLAIDAPARWQLQNALCTKCRHSRRSAPQDLRLDQRPIFPNFAIVRRVSQP
jgi:hypothetical protein